ncbi:hypothetical protein AGMMS4956_03030 [Bacteroidia bacterium]|nr:hypothetical protein AGMMS4956_03030 [Bacteroidia bacterium]
MAMKAKQLFIYCAAAVVVAAAAVPAVAASPPSISAITPNVGAIDGGSVWQRIDAVSPLIASQATPTTAQFSPKTQAVTK